MWWVLRIAHWAAGVPAASMPVPSGLPGFLLVGAASILTAVLWRWRWFRAAMAVVAAGVLAWSLSGLLAGAGGAVGRT
jgi:competence protein ComEC